jgi:hypothetical protein
MKFILTISTIPLFCAGVLTTSMSYGQPYVKSDNSLFKKTEIPNLPCSSFLEPNAVNTTLLADSLTKTLTCLEQSQFPKTARNYQEIFQFHESIQNVENNLIPDWVQDKTEQLKYNLEREETFIQYHLLAFIISDGILIFFMYLLILSGIVFPLDLVLMRQQGSL